VSALLAAFGVLLVVLGLVWPPEPWIVLWAPGLGIIVAAYARHADPQQRARRRQDARRGYLL
jgi:hypothetical protein